MENRNNKSKQELFRRFIIILGVIAIAFGAFKIWENFNMYNVIKKDNSELRKKAVHESKNDPLKRRINFAHLKRINPDIIAWIYIPGTYIDYPVLKGRTNDSYLRTNFRRRYSYGGSIFMEHENRRDFSDGNTILYGHNMRNGTMFGTLNRFASQGFMNRHTRTYVYFPGRKVNVYSNFTYSVIRAGSPQYVVEPGNFRNYVTDILDTARTKRWVSMKKAPLLMLSTCYTHGTSYRRVLHCYLKKTVHQNA